MKSHEAAPKAFSLRVFSWIVPAGADHLSKEAFAMLMDIQPRKTCIIEKGHGPFPDQLVLQSEQIAEFMILRCREHEI